jgi:uncharacterized repeat protein (TIGR01451 family)
LPYTAPEGTPVWRDSRLSFAIADDVDPITGTNQPGCGNSDCVTYTIAVANAGPDPAAGIQVVTQLPPNGSFFEAVGTGWICPAPLTTLTCTRVSQGVGPAPPIKLIWKAPSPGGYSIVVNTAVSSASTDTVPDNNTATQGTFVQPWAISARIAVSGRPSAAGAVAIPR